MTSYFKYRGLEYANAKELDLAIKANHNAIDPIIKSYFWLSVVEDLNDPFEGLFINEITKEMYALTHGISLQEKNALHLNFIELSRKLDEFTKRSGVFSLSKTYKDELMWSHYAASHCGICIEYDFDLLVRFVFGESLHSFAVDYGSAPPSVGINNVDKYNAGDIKSLSLIHI